MILNKRIPRNIKANFLRWLSLFLLVFLGMFMVVSIVTSAEVVTQDIEKFAEKQNLEDGEFTVFVPLTDKDIKYLLDKGYSIEESFYIDFTMNDNVQSTLRIFKNRKEINLQSAVEGASANHENQMMIERHYAEKHDLKVGDKLKVADIEFEITGIGVSPDYDNCKQNISDVGINHSGFGTAFVTDEAYEKLKATNKYKNTEEYLYSYKLGGNANDDLKEILQNLEFDTDAITDKYLREIIDETENEKNEIIDGVNDLKDAGHELEDGLGKLSDGTAELSDSMKLFSQQLNASFSQNAAMKSVLENAKKLYDGSKEISDNTAKAHDGSAEFADAVDEAADKIVELVDENFEIDIENLTMFITAEDNTRIMASVDDVVQKKSSGTISGVLVLLLITYVISVFIVHEINDESAVIGALYSMGVSKGSLLKHYVMLPVVITFVGGLIGTALAFTPIGVGTMLVSMINYYSMPDLEYVYPVYMIIYGIVLPPLIAFIVNTIVINGKLSQTPLSLLRKQSKNNVRKINLKPQKKNFVNQFRIRQFIRELRTSFTIFIGMLISLMFLLLSITCFCSLDNFEAQNKQDLTYKYMYSLKYELDDDEIPENSEKCYVKTLSKEAFGHDMNVTLVGISPNSKYFKFDVQDKKNTVVMGSSAAIKFNLKAGDKVSFEDKLDERIYLFEITDVEQYSVGLYMFMDIDRMRTLFDCEDDYFNVLLSDNELDIDTNKIYSVTKDSDILYFAKSFKSNLNGVIYMMLFGSIIMFVVVMYLMINIMLDKSANNIALMKIFGYNDKEVKKLYLDGNFLVVLISAIINVPLAKMCTDSIWPLMVSSMQCGFDVSLPYYIYVVVFAAIFVCYFIVSFFLMRKIKKITPAELLKNRE